MKTIKSLIKFNPDKLKKEIREIQKTELPKSLKRWIKEYEKIGNRNEFFWKFIYVLDQIINPFNLTNKYKKSIDETKVLITMYIILLDDIVDSKIQNENILNSLSKIPFDKNYKIPHKANNYEKKYIKFGAELWKEIEKRVKKYPLSKKLYSAFNYDITQTINAMNYTYLINKNPNLINKTEHWLYSPHTLQGLINCTLDSMCASKFRANESGKAREVFWLTQKIARIANCLTTWENELKKGDLTNTLFVYLIESNSLSINEFSNKNKEEFAQKIKKLNIVNQLLGELKTYHNEIISICKKIKHKSFRNFPSQVKKMYILYLIAGESTK